MILKLIEKILDKVLLPNKHFQDYVNDRFKDDSRIIIPKNMFEYVTINKMKFYFNSTISSIYDDLIDYSIEDLRQTDIVLDIGSCSGGFSLRVASKVKHVYAIEPISTEIVKQNIKLNNVDNITVFDCGLGNGETEIKWGITKKVKCLSLSEIIQQCGGHIDFLKSDCEGGEWSIKPEELKGIRRIEAEIHHFKDMPQFTEFEDTLKKAGFDYEKEILNKGLMFIHARARETLEGELKLKLSPEKTKI